MEQHTIHQLTTISEFHEIANLPKPQHPLISLVDYAQVDYQFKDSIVTWIQSFYTIGLKRNIHGKFIYGQQTYDFNEGLLSFIGPGQRIRYEFLRQDPKPTGWLLIVHPDFLWNTTLAKAIKYYEFFGYAVNEALFLSDKEENLILSVMQQIQVEYHSNIDKFSQNIIVAQMEVLFNYAERFYQRQFITRKILNHQVLGRLEDFLEDYFNSEDVYNKGIPNVVDISEKLHISPNYLSSLLKNLTGQNTQQHIHEKLIQKAKEKLTTTNFSIGEIAFQLGFEHSQSFSRLFKKKTKLSPIEFRANFN
tara:strand:- start:17470 stop:18387 length:918 start_codon:yes stop_codon:yes gene_type:complete